MAWEFDAKVQAGVIDLDEDVKDDPEEKERLRRSWEHTGRLPNIQGPRLRRSLNKVHTKPIGPWPPTPSVPVEIGLPDTHVMIAQPMAPSASNIAPKPGKKIDSVSGHMIVDNLDDDTAPSTLSLPKLHLSPEEKVNKLDRALRVLDRKVRKRMENIEERNPNEKWNQRVTVITWTRS